MVQVGTDLEEEEDARVCTAAATGASASGTADDAPFAVAEEKYHFYRLAEDRSFFVNQCGLAVAGSGRAGKK